MNKKEQLIQKLFANQCSQKELISLFELIRTEEEEIAPEVMDTLLQQMEKVPKLDKETSERILDKVLKETTDVSNIRQLKTRNRFSWIGKIAAVALIVVIAGWFIFQNSSSSEILVETNFGEQKSIELPDGSLVKLNANSSLTYHTNWEDEDIRQVKLQGEAFFEVEKKIATNQKFQVITKDLTVEVLGTVFNINTHQEKTKVFLEEGKVKLNLNGSDQPLLMEPGEIVAYAKGKKESLIKEQVAPMIHTSWKDGLLLFENTPLKDVLEKMEEIYGVTIQVEDSTQFSREITTGLPVENKEDAISILQATLGLKILEVEDGFVIQ